MLHKNCFPLCFVFILSSTCNYVNMLRNNANRNYFHNHDGFRRCVWTFCVIICSKITEVHILLTGETMLNLTVAFCPAEGSPRFAQATMLPVRHNDNKSSLWKLTKKAEHGAHHHWEPRGPAPPARWWVWNGQAKCLIKLWQRQVGPTLSGTCFPSLLRTVRFLIFGISGRDISVGRFTTCTKISFCVTPDDISKYQNQMRPQLLFSSF